jgi:hypothetical protein
MTVFVCSSNQLNPLEAKQAEGAFLCSIFFLY